MIDSESVVSHATLNSIVIVSDDFGAYDGRVGNERMAINNRARLQESGFPSLMEQMECDKEKGCFPGCLQRVLCPASSVQAPFFS